MSVLSGSGGAEYISFGAVSAVRGLSQKTISAWIYLTSSNDGTFLYLDPNTIGTDEFYQVSIQSSSGAKLYFAAGWTTANGSWRTSSALTTSAWHHVAVTYNNGATTNKPLFYVDGASASRTDITAPVGTLKTGTGNTLSLCGETGVAPHLGYLADVRVYNTILTAGQVLALYNDGVFTPNYDTNLVFHAMLNDCTAKSGAAFDGLTLTSSNLLSDRVNCVTGTPSGSPVGSDINPT